MLRLLTNAPVRWSTWGPIDIEYKLSSESLILKNDEKPRRKIRFVNVVDAFGAVRGHADGVF